MYMYVQKSNPAIYPDITKIIDKRKHDKSTVVSSVLQSVVLPLLVPFRTIPKSIY